MPEAISGADGLRHSNPRTMGPKFLAAAALGAALSSWMTLSPPPAAAQVPARDTTARDTTARAAADTATLPSSPPVRQQPIVVRVLRTPVDLDAAPMAVSVVDLRTASPRARLGLGDLIEGVPGLQVHNRYNKAEGDRIIVRGFGARTQFGVRGVRVLVDGIPATLPDGQSTLNQLDLALLERVEIVRGPAAMVHGNAAGGVLLLQTRPPTSRVTGARTDVEAATGGLLRLTADTYGPAGVGGWRAAVSRERVDGVRAHASSNRWNLTARTLIPAAGGELNVTAHAVKFEALDPGGLTAEQFAADPRQAQPYSVAQAAGEEGLQGQMGATWARTLGGWALEVSGWGISRGLDNPIPPSVIRLDRSAGGARVLARSTGSPGPLWTAGIETGGQWDRRRNYENDGGSCGTLTLKQDERVLDLAVFAQAMLTLAPRRLTLFTAARYDRVRFDATDHFITADDPDDSGHRTMAAFSPALGLTFTPTAGATFFANVSTSFQTPTTTELVNRPDGAGGFNPALEPERTVSLEAGTRLRLGDAVSAELTAYRAHVRHTLVPFEVPDVPGRRYFRNAGGAVHEGIEAAANVTVADTRVAASWALTHATFSAYSVADQDYAGLRVPGIRPWIAEFRAHRPLGGPLRGAVSVRVAGAMPADDANRITADGYAVAGASIDARPIRAGRVRISPYLGIDNIFDAVYASSVVVNASRERYFEPAPGRVVFAGLSVEL